jgi:hypothetical protein
MGVHICVITNVVTIDVSTFANRICFNIFFWLGNFGRYFHTLTAYQKIDRANLQAEGQQTSSSSSSNQLPMLHHMRFQMVLSFQFNFNEIDQVHIIYFPHLAS